MKTTTTYALRAAIAAFFAVLAPAAAAGGDVSEAFDREEIKPYLKVMKGPWVGNSLTGSDGDYRIVSELPAESKYIIGLFDRKVGRTGNDERCAVVLVDGVNPLAPSEKVDIEEASTADVTGFRKYPLNGLSYNSIDNTGEQCCLLVVDAKEEYEFGEVKPFAIPSNRIGKILGRVHVFVFAGPSMPPTPGQVVKYGRPLDKFAFTLHKQE